MPLKIKRSNTSVLISGRPEDTDINQNPGIFVENETTSDRSILPQMTNPREILGITSYKIDLYKANP